jgi:hypothetical protein
MVEAVERILSGEDYISPPLAKRLGRRMAG